MVTERRLSLQSISCFSLIFLSVLAGGCAVHIGPTIGVPAIRPPSVRAEERRNLQLAVRFGEIRDSRTPADNGLRVDQPYTEPQGAAGEAVRQALVKAFQDQGVQPRSNAPLRVEGEIRRWRTKVVTKTTSAINSEASLYVEIVDRAGNRLYSGTYHGTRASEFPLASANDVKESLGLAMTQAIEQVLNDEELITALWQKQ